MTQRRLQSTSDAIVHLCKILLLPAYQGNCLTPSHIPLASAPAPMALLQMYEKKKKQRLSRIKTRKKSQRAGNQMEIKSQGGFQGICSSELKVRYQPALCACVCGERGRHRRHSVLTLPCRILFPFGCCPATSP